MKLPSHRRGLRRSLVHAVVVLAALVGGVIQAPAAHAETQPITLTTVSQLARRECVFITVCRSFYEGTAVERTLAVTSPPLRAIARVQVWQLTWEIGYARIPAPPGESSWQGFGSWRLAAANGDSLVGDLHDPVGGSDPTWELSVTAGTGAFAGFTSPSTRQPAFPAYGCPMSVIPDDSEDYLLCALSASGLLLGELSFTLTR